MWATPKTASFQITDGHPVKIIREYPRLKAGNRILKTVIFLEIDKLNIERWTMVKNIKTNTEKIKKGSSLSNFKL